MSLVLDEERLSNLKSSMMMLNSFQQFVQQIPVITTANLLAMATEANRSLILDPLAEIRNGQSSDLTFEGEKIRRAFSSSFESGTRVASFSRGDHRFRPSPRLQVTVHFLASSSHDSLSSQRRILIVFVLANYLHLIDETRLTLNYMVSSLLYEETLSFPIELICVEFGYLIASIAFEVGSFCG